MSDLNGHHNFHDDGIGLVSYIYGELDAASRSAFEAHLTECDECVFQLAAFADARLGVVEWRRADFDVLEMPVILIPDNSPFQPAREGIFSGYAKSLTALPLFARAGIGLAAAALLVTLIYFSLPKPRSNEEIAVNSNSGMPTVKTKGPEIEGPSASATQPDVFAQDKRDIQDAPHFARREPSVSRGTTASRQLRVSTPVQTRKRNPQMQAVTPAPRLNTFEEDDDKSLRLTDLFAEIGTSDD